MDIVILAAGYGNRMGDLTKNYPKQMLPVAGKPVLEWNILFIKENLKLRDIIIVTGYKEEIIKDYFKDGKDFGVNISYVTQNLDKVRGLAAALSIVQNVVSNNFIVILGDNLYNGPFLKVIHEHLSQKNDVTIHIEEVKDPSRYGVVIMDKTNPKIVESLEEKPKNPKSNLVITGFYVFNKLIFDAIKNIELSYRGELELTDAINLLCEKEKVCAVLINGWRKDIGYKDDLLDASFWVMNNIIGERYEILSEIDDSNKVIPPVYIGKNCSVKNSIIGPYSCIGDNVIVNGSEIVESIILDNSIVNNRNIKYNVIMAE